MSSIHYISLYSDALTGSDLAEDISKKIFYVLKRKITYTGTSTEEDLITKIKSVFTPEMETLFKDYKITLQIRPAATSCQEILFDLVTDVFNYYQKKSNGKLNQIALCFGVHYSNIMHASGNSPETHISDLFARYPTVYASDSKITTSKIHYKKTGIEIKRLSNDIVTDKIYYYLDSNSELLEKILDFLLAIHKSMDSADKNVETVLAANFKKNRQAFPSGSPLMIHNIILEDPLSTASKVPEMEKTSGSGSTYKVKQIIDEKDSYKEIITIITGTPPPEKVAVYVPPSLLSRASKYCVPTSYSTSPKSYSAFGSPSTPVRRFIPSTVTTTPSMPSEPIKITPEYILSIDSRRIENTDSSINSEEFNSEKYNIADKSTLTNGEELIIFRDNDTTIKTIKKIIYNSTDRPMQFIKDSPNVFFFRKKSAEGGNMDPYYLKYLKYKTKYLKLKKSLVIN
jgi:hypothetical protein